MLHIQGPMFATSLEHAERIRAFYAVARGLAPETSWEDIRTHDEDALRMRKVRRYKLAEDTPMKAIERHEWELKMAADKEELKAQARELCLDETASEAEIHEARWRLPEGMLYQNYPVDPNGKLVIPINDDEL